MKTLQIILAGCLMLSTATIHAALPEVTSVRAEQRPGTKIVDIHYDVTDEDGDLLRIRVEVSNNEGLTYSVPAFSFTGDIGDGIEPGEGKHIVWDAGVDWDGEYSDQMRIKVIATDAMGLPGLEWGQEVPPGGFLMGQDGGVEGSGPSRHLNIPWSYWLSKYEIRNDQYNEFLNIALVAGDVWREGVGAARANEGVYAGVPKDGLLIRLGDGYDIRWSVNNFEVVNGRDNFPVRVSWYGAIAFAQHYGYDLPTAAEWEKAARGPDHEGQDTHLLYPWGNEINGGNANVNPWRYTTSPVGYYDGNQTPFGPDMANAYGLYDMIGNVAEWTRTFPVNNIESYPQPENLGAEIHRLDSPSGARIMRGGSFNGYALPIYSSPSANRSQWPGDTGFRVIRRDLP